MHSRCKPGEVSTLPRGQVSLQFCELEEAQCLCRPSRYSTRPYETALAHPWRSFELARSVASVGRFSWSLRSVGAALRAAAQGLALPEHLRRAPPGSEAKRSKGTRHSRQRVSSWRWIKGRPNLGVPYLERDPSWGNFFWFCPPF